MAGGPVTSGPGKCGPRSRCGARRCTIRKIYSSQRGTHRSRRRPLGFPRSTKGAAARECRKGAALACVCSSLRRIVRGTVRHHGPAARGAHESPCPLPGLLLHPRRAKQSRRHRRLERAGVQRSSAACDHHQSCGPCSRRNREYASGNVECQRQRIRPVASRLR